MNKISPRVPRVIYDDEYFDELERKNKLEKLKPTKPLSPEEKFIRYFFLILTIAVMLLFSFSIYMPNLVGNFIGITVSFGGTILSFIVVIIIVIILFWFAKKWITIYNWFQSLFTSAERKFADIDVIMQERIDKLSAMAEIVKKYDVHEYETLKDVIEARMGWSKDLELNKKVEITSQIENSFIKLQSLFERYPNLKADALHLQLLGKSSVSNVEKMLRESRLKYNEIAQDYNLGTRKFPRSIVARVHGFIPLEYFVFRQQESYKPREIFGAD